MHHKFKSQLWPNLQILLLTMSQFPGKPLTMDTEILYQCVSISVTVTVDITDITLSAAANDKLTTLQTMQTKDTNYT